MEKRFPAQELSIDFVLYGSPCMQNINYEFFETCVTLQKIYEAIRRFGEPSITFFYF